MKNLSLFLSLVIVVVNMVSAQETKLFQTEERKTLDTLAQLKVEFDRALYIEKKKEINLESRKSLGKYLAYIHRIKKDPVRSKLLTYMDQVMQRDPKYLKNTFQYYTYIDKSLPLDRSKIISNYDFYKIVKHYLFEKDMNRLPELKDVSIIEVKQWRIPAREDIKGILNK